MKITIDTNILIKNIQLALNTIDTKGLNPILESILFEVNENSITLVTSNNLCYSQINIKEGFEIESTGKFLVKGKMIINILNSLKSKELTLEIIDESVLKIYNDKFSCNLNILDPNSYPNISFQYSDWTNFKLSNKFIQKINDKLNSFVAYSNDEANVLNGICLDTDNNDNLIKAIATDSYHLSYYQEPYTGTKFKIIISTKILNFLNILSVESKEQPNLWWSNGKLIIEDNQNIFFFKLLESDYPSVYKTLESNYNNVFDVDKSTLIDAVNRTLPLIQNEKDATFNLLIEKDKISISSKNIEFGDSFEEIQITNANFNEKFDFLLNVRYLNHILKAIDNKTITFNFININKPILITDKKEENLKFLILPLRH
ncbi:MAG: DNA polymerase III subunit beta [Mycoplasma sp.]|nr:DNA polymerase III subunit beta [Mycoplasma sp.]